MITIELKPQEANILAEMLSVALDEMIDWSSYSKYERIKSIKDKVYTQMIDAGAKYNDESIPKF